MGHQLTCVNLSFPSRNRVSDPLGHPLLGTPGPPPDSCCGLLLGFRPSPTPSNPLLTQSHGLGVGVTVKSVSPPSDSDLSGDCLCPQVTASLSVLAPARSKTCPRRCPLSPPWESPRSQRCLMSLWPPWPWSSPVPGTEDRLPGCLWNERVMEVIDVGGFYKL